MRNEMRRSITFALLIAVIIVITNSCSNGIVDPEPQAGRRDYVWKLDTLKMPVGEFATLGGLWGSSPNDVWVCGGASSNQFRLWHYDGNKWNNVETGFQIYDAFQLYGFNSNKVWVVTAFGVIGYYNGSKWNMIGNYSNNDEILVLQGIWGRSESELYAYGFLDRRDMSSYRGCIMKYNGESWSFLKIENISTNFLTMGYDEEYKKYFLHSYASQDGAQCIYELKENTLIKLYESKEETKVFIMKGRAYFRVGKKIMKYSNNGLYVWKNFSNDPQFVGVLDGRSEKDIIIGGPDGIEHYNGENISLLYKTDIWPLSYTMFEKSVFIVGKNFQKGINVVIHGHLIN